MACKLSNNSLEFSFLACFSEFLLILAFAKFKFTGVTYLLTNSRVLRILKWLDLPFKNLQNHIRDVKEQRQVRTEQMTCFNFWTKYTGHLFPYHLSSASICMFSGGS